MNSPFFAKPIDPSTHRAWSGVACLVATLLFLTIVWSPTAATLSDAGRHNAPANTANEPLPAMSCTGEEYCHFLPSIYSLKEIVDQGDIWDVPDDFASRTIEEGLVHRWRIELYTDEVMGITVIAAAPADIVLSLTQYGQPIIERQNDSPAGEAEVMRTPAVATSGDYEILIETADRSAAKYAISTYLPGVFEIEFKGFLTSGEPQQQVYVPFEAMHYWFFIADADDLLTMVLTPDENSDIVGEIYAPRIGFWESVDFGFAGEIEQITDLPLPESGMYAIRILELDFDDPGMVYDIVVDWSHGDAVLP